MKKEMNFAMITKIMGAMRNRLNNGESIFLYLIAYPVVLNYINIIISTIFMWNLPVVTTRHSW